MNQHQEQDLPSFVTERLDALRRQAGHLRSDANLCKEASETAQRKVFEADTALRHLPDPVGFINETRRNTAALQIEQATAHLSTARTRLSEAENALRSAYALGRASQAALTNATDFLNRLPHGSVLVDALPAKPRSLSEVRTALSAARDALTRLLVRPRPVEELKETAARFVADSAASLSFTTRLDPQTDTLSVLFGGITSNAPVLPLLAAVVPDKLVDLFTAELKNAQRGCTGDPIPKAERVRAEQSLRQQIESLEQEEHAALLSEKPVGDTGPPPRPEVLLGVRVESGSAQHRQPGISPAAPTVLQHVLSGSAQAA